MHTKVVSKLYLILQKLKSNHALQIKTLHNTLEESEDSNG